jgi:hypothetical protein
VLQVTRKSVFICLLVPVLFAMLGQFSSALAQSGIVVVDIKALFKAHTAFNTQLEGLRQLAESQQAETVELQQRLARKAELLRQYDAFSSEFREGEADLAREAAAAEVAMRNKMFNLVKAEAKLHYDTYQQINGLIAEYCQQRDLNLVLRHSPIEMSPANPESVMQGVNHQIIFYRPSRDITADIVSLLTRDTQKAQSSDRGGSR